MGTDWTIYALILYCKVMFLFANSLQLAYKPLKIHTKVKEILNNWNDLQQSTEQSLMNHWISPDWAFYGITVQEYHYS